MKIAKYTYDNFNVNKLSSNASQYENMRDFINKKLSTECQIHQYINFDYQHQEDNWINYLNVNSDNELSESPIQRFNIYQKSTNKFIFRIQLKSGFYFEDQHYTNLDKDIFIGNVYFKNQESTEPKFIDIKFNSKRFYELLKDQQINTWSDFINYVSPKMLNFNDSYFGEHLRCCLGCFYS